MKFRETNLQQGAELELAPMIDVVFLLLIFFIVTWKSAKFERDMDISVPAAEETTDQPSTVAEIIVNVRQDGTIIVNGSELSEEELLAKLNLISQDFPDQAVILRGSSEAEFQNIINVLDQIKKAGIWNVAFATTRPANE